MANIHSESNSSHIATKYAGEFDCEAGSLHKARPENCADAGDNSPSDLLLQAFRGLELSSCEQKQLPDTRSCSCEGPCECEVVISTEVVKVRLWTSFWNTMTVVRLRLLFIRLQ